MNHEDIKDGDILRLKPCEPERNHGTRTIKETLVKVYQKYSATEIDLQFLSRPEDGVLYDRHDPRRSYVAGSRDAFTVHPSALEAL